MNIRRIPTDFLVAKPSFASGFARLVDFGCAFDAYNHSSSPEQADARGILSDWISVGFDLADAIDIIDDEKKIA
jgi:hypothetical protein